MENPFTEDVDDGTGTGTTITINKYTNAYVAGLINGQSGLSASSVGGDFTTGGSATTSGGESKDIYDLYNYTIDEIVNVLNVTNGYRHLAMVYLRKHWYF